MTTTITGKDTRTLENEMRALYALYCDQYRSSVCEEHANNVDAFSRLIMFYVKRININTKIEDFYRDFMSIKVLQLVYLTWKQKNDAEAKYTYQDLSNIVVLPGVFSPYYASDSYLWATHLVKSGIAQNKRVLEMGAGSGIISLYLNLYGNPSHLVAADVNDRAVANMRENIKKFDVELTKFSVIKSDLYSAINDKNKFDIILWAFVWLKLENQEMVNIIKNETNPEIKNLLNSVIDPKYTTLKRFLSESKTYLAPQGKLLLITTDFINNEELKSIAENLGYSFSIEKFSDNSEVVKGVNMVIDLYQISLEVMR